MPTPSFASPGAGSDATAYSPVPRQPFDHQYPDWQPQNATDEGDVRKTTSTPYTTEYVPSLQEEPKGSQILPKDKVDVETIVADVVAVAIPLALIGFAIATLLKHGKEASDQHIEDWRNVASVLSTLFPVLFAAVLGRLMTQAARWKLEQGSTLQSLEQLLGSRTVGGAVLSPFHLRSFNFLAAGLLLLWAFSPLGAQAMLRIVEPRLSIQETEKDVVYYDTKDASRFSDMRPYKLPSPIANDIQVDILGTLYNSLLLAPMSSKNNAMDLWGNVKIPLFSSLPKSSEENGWLDIPESNSVYSALVGLPIVNMTRGNTTLYIESTYLEVSCEELQFDTALPGSDAVREAFFEEVNQTAIASVIIPSISSLDVPNGTFQGLSMDNVSKEVLDVFDYSPWGIYVDRLIDLSWTMDTSGWSTDVNGTEDEFGTAANSLKMFKNEPGIEAGPTRLVFQSQIISPFSGGSTGYVKTYCNATQQYIESKVFCERNGQSEADTCRAVSQRPSQKPHGPKEITYLSFPDSLYYVSGYLPDMGGDVGDQASLDLTLQYLINPAVPNAAMVGNMVQGEGTMTELENLDKKDRKAFSRRLTQALNSFLHISQMTTWVPNGLPSNEEKLPGTIRTTSKVTNNVTLFNVPKLWFTLCVFSCFLLLAGGLASVVFAHLACGPEVLGYASTAIRDNKHISLPSETVALDGTEITHIHSDMRVRFGVVREAAEEQLGVGYQDGVTKIEDALNMRRG